MSRRPKISMATAQPKYTIGLLANMLPGPLPVVYKLGTGVI